MPYINGGDHNLGVKQQNWQNMIHSLSYHIYLSLCYDLQLFRQLIFIQPRQTESDILSTQSIILM